jgi:hypothetical protein
MASRKEQKEALRAERERREQEAAAAERRKRMIGYGAAGGLVLAAVIAIAVVVLATGGDGGGESHQDGRAAEPNTQDIAAVPIPEPQATNLEDAAKAANCELEQHEAEGRDHVSGEVDYKTSPPNSGNHFEFPAEDGVYAGDGAPSLEPLVHSLEHGRVIFWHRPDATPELQGQIKSLYDEDNYHVIAAPHGRDMEAQLAASSWTRTLTCERVTDETWDAMRLFRDRYRDQAPERVP